MNPKKLFPMFVTDKLAETKAFYTEKAGFAITHDMDGYLTSPRTLDDFIKSMTRDEH